MGSICPVFLWLYVLLGFFFFFVWFGLFVKVLEYSVFLFINSQDSLIKDSLIRSPGQLNTFDVKPHSLS